MGKLLVFILSIVIGLLPGLAKAIDDNTSFVVAMGDFSEPYQTVALLCQASDGAAATNIPLQQTGTNFLVHNASYTGSDSYIQSLLYPGDDKHMVDNTLCTVQITKADASVVKLGDFTLNHLGKWTTDGDYVIRWSANVNNLNTHASETVFMNAVQASPLNLYGGGVGYQQITMNLHYIQGGALSFDGDLPSATNLFVNCAGKTPLALKNNSIAIENLFPTNTDPNTSVDVNNCNISTDPAGQLVTVYATFNLKTLSGKYSASTIPKMWAVALDSLKSAQSTYVFTAQTSNCDQHDATLCNQTTVSFHQNSPISAGEIDLQNIAATGSMVCDQGSYPFTRVDSSTLRLDLATLHGAGAPATSVNLINCQIAVGLIKYTLDILGINGARSPAAQPTQTMWSAQVTNLTGGLVFAAPPTGCDSTGNNCNSWTLTDNV